MNLSPLWNWINERHRIYLARKKDLPFPWTKDKILQSYRFCNVFRELDTVTIWLRENWREPFADHPNLWFAMCVARQTNHIPTFIELGFPDGDLLRYVARSRDILGEMRAKKEKIYGSAYIITAGGQSIDKYLYTCDHVLKPLAKWAPNLFAKNRTGSVKEMWAALRKFDGFGPFVAYEVASDLRHTRYYDGTDHMTWANAGPGAKRGICRLMFGDKSTKGRGLDDDYYLAQMRSLLQQSKSCLEPHVPPLEMRDIEHSLCETDKYLRVKNNEGRPKEKYHAP